MRFNVVTCYNTVTEKFLPPQIFREMKEEEIIEDNVNAFKLGKIDRQTASISILYSLGYYDDKTGKFDLLDEPKMLIDLSQLTKVKKAEVEEHATSN